MSFTFPIGDAIGALLLTVSIVSSIGLFLVFTSVRVEYSAVTLRVVGNEILPEFINSSNWEAHSALLELINSGSISFPTTRSVTAEYSTRTEVNTRKRPMEDTIETVSKRAPMASPIGKVNDIAPSAVICVKTDQSESEVIQLFNPLGLDLVDTLFVLGKNMVFVEFKNIQESTTALN
jgi:hypothetical protein